jgi:hypothetical protein
MHESLDEEDDEEDEDDPDVEEESSEEDDDEDDEGTVDESESPSSSFLATGDDPLHTAPCILFQSLDFFFVIADLICGALIGLAVSSGEYDDDVAVVRSVVVGEEVATE